jgi:hypothetical protein
VINVLDTAGLAALEIVMAQVEAAKQSGLLIDVPDEPVENPNLPAGEEGDALLARDGVAVPIPAKRRGRAPRGKKS